jgi:succinate dehydrogenase hydrophobic anchor subunit
MMYRLKRQYRPSARVSAVFCAAFALAVITFLLVVAATALEPEETYTFDVTFRVTAPFILSFFICLVLVAAAFVLWIGMLHFLITYDGRPSGTRALWLIITVCGLSYGAALYYWLVYRKIARTSLSAAPILEGSPSGTNSPT